MNSNAQHEYMQTFPRFPRFPRGVNSLIYRYVFESNYVSVRGELKRETLSIKSMLTTELFSYWTYRVRKCVYCSYGWILTDGSSIVSNACYECAKEFTQMM